MDIDRLRQHLERAASDEGLTARRVELTPDGRTVIVADDSGTAAMPVSPFMSIDLDSEAAYPHVARIFAERTYASAGTQEYLDTAGLSPEAMRLRLPEHPGHLGADYSEPPAGTARNEPE